ncbi:MAG: SagB/ThcOx family dehydrogenase [Candidatus Neptunochlamydia sp.]|nr:SagB/ThcOx family dehydrogenase [Candidatus Neptunochlamydia sp.]
MTQNKTVYWSDFHQASSLCDIDRNSTIGFQIGIDNIKKLQEALIHDSYPSLPLIDLLVPSNIDCSLSEAILRRRSCRKPMISNSLSLQNFSDILYYGYGKAANGFRHIPSGGALYPLEIYIYCNDVESIDSGLYYYSSQHHGIKNLFVEKSKKDLESLFVDYNTVKNASAYIFITASFLKTVWKYSERGYRFSLMEAGHLAQNINLVAAAKSLACLNIGGFFDLKSNQFLELDGVLDANLYIICLGVAQRL